MLEEINKRIRQYIDIIESRIYIAKMDEKDMGSYMQARYIDDRGLGDYFTLMPNLIDDLKANKIVLDIGCGTGAALEEIKRKYSCDVIGTSLNRTCNYDFPVLMDKADSVSLPNDSCDLIISVHGLSWEPNQRKAINEIVRMLKPGGVAHIYLITFSHSIALFIGSDFWNDIDVIKYKEKYEFDLSMVTGSNSIVEHEYLDEIVDGHFKEWYITIRK